MSWFQKEILISPKKRGFHIITNEVLNQLEEILLYKVGKSLEKEREPFYNIHDNSSCMQ